MSWGSQNILSQIIPWIGDSLNSDLGQTGSES